MKTLILALLVMVALTGAAYAGCGGCHGASACGGAVKEKGIINGTCPVMGGAIDKDTPHWARYKDRKIGFCCAQCVTEFQKDPEKYLEKLETDQSG